MTLAPKARFLKTPHAKLHADIVVTESFQSACEAAMLEMQVGLPAATNPANGWDAHSRMQGAKDFLYILLNLAEPEKPRQSIGDRNLKT